MIVIPEDINLSYYDNGTDIINIKDNPASFTRLKNFTDSFSPSSFFPPVSEVLLPPGVLYVNDSLLIYEKPPCIKNYFHIYAQLESIDSNITEHIYSLPLPWQVYVVNHSFTNESEMYIKDIYMYFSNSSIQSFDQPVYLPPLGNFWSNGKLCRPYFNNMADVTVPNNNIPGLIELSYNWVWNSGYNSDLTESILQAFIWSHANSAPIFPNLFIQHSNYTPTSSYFVSKNDAEQLFTAWQNLSLEDVLFVNWPSPSPFERYFEYYSRIVSSNNFSEWILNNGIDSSSDCCYDCQCYDEDGNLIEDSFCQYEECECHSEDYLSLNNLYRFLSHFNAFDSNVSLRKMILSFLEERHQKQFDFLSPLSLY